MHEGHAHVVDVPSSESPSGPPGAARRLDPDHRPADPGRGVVRVRAFVPNETGRSRSPGCARGRRRSPPAGPDGRPPRRGPPPRAGRGGLRPGTGRGRPARTPSPWVRRARCSRGTRRAGGTARPAQPRDEPVGRGGVVGVVHGDQVPGVAAVAAGGVVGDDHAGGEHAQHDRHVPGHPGADVPQVCGVVNQWRPGRPVRLSEVRVPDPRAGGPAPGTVSGSRGGQPWLRGRSPARWWPGR